MTVVTIHQAKTHLSRLIKEALAGGEVTIAQGRTGEALVKIVPAKPIVGKRRVPNRFAHLIAPGTDILADGFWDPLPPEHLGLGTDDDGA
jgi:antitoxin (DNA-binding transcriptional repressor) of toxin-antitoxin stability system